MDPGHHMGELTSFLFAKSEANLRKTFASLPISPMEEDKWGD